LSYSFNFGAGGTVGGSSNPENAANKTFTHSIGTPGTYPTVLTTTNAVGCTATANESITVLANPVAALSVTPNAGCVGIQYTAVASNNSTLGGFGSWATNNPFQWTITPNGQASTTQFTQTPGAQVSTPINVTSTVALQVTDGWGCTSSASATATVQQPVADFTLPSAICNGDAAVADGSVSSGNGLTYEWYTNMATPSGTPAGTNVTLPQVLSVNNGTTSQTYSVLLVVEDNLGCPDTSVVKTVTVSAPIANFTDVKSGSATDEFGNFVCPPVIVNFTDQSQSVGTITSHSWYLALPPSAQGNPFSAPITTSQTSPQGMQYLYPGTYDLAYIIQDQFGCVDTMYVDNFLVIQGPSGTPTITDNGGICGQDFTFNLTNTTNVSSWTWNLGDGSTVASADEPDNTFIHGYSGVQTYYPVVTLVDAVGCAVPYPDTVIIQPNGVNADFTINPEVISLGTNVFFTDESSSTGGNINQWYWSYGDNSYDTLLNAANGNTTHQYIVGGDIPITLTVVDDRGCTDDYTAYITIDVRFDMPNVFTGAESGGPNGDLLLFADVFKDFEIVFVNRWGNVVYEGVRDATKPRYLWNGIDQKSGKLCQDGTYYYILKGTLLNDEVIDIHGFVTLIGSRTKL
jgi:hypothetical protein